MNLLIDNMNHLILKHLSEGLTIKEIAGNLNMTKRTTERRIRKLKAEVGVKNNTELVLYAERNNLLNSVN